MRQGSTDDSGTGHVGGQRDPAATTATLEPADAAIDTESARMLRLARSWGRHWIESNARMRQRALRIARMVGYDTRRWTRIVYQEECHRIIRTLGPERLDVLEISAGAEWRSLPFRSYQEANYPAFDICREVLDQKFDLIIADQVFEHLLWPYRAGRNVLGMLRPGGYFLVMTPFLVRIHEVPFDCSRWTETGLHHLLAECGFDFAAIHTGSWGNRACVKAALVHWPRVGWGASMRNEPQYPVVVWALAQAPTETDSRR